MLKIPHRTRETTTTTGTGALSLGGAATNCQSFVAGVGDGNRTTYTIVDTANGTWERGIGTVTDGSPDTLSRDLVLESSNGGALVNLAAGTKDVFVDHDAAMIAAAFIDVIPKTASFSIDVLANGILHDVDCAGGAVTATLPDLADVWVGWSTSFRISDATNALTIDGAGSEQIGVDNTYRLDKVGQSVTIVKTSATKWQAVGVTKGPNTVLFTSGAVADPSGFNTTAGTYTPAPGVTRIDVEGVGGGGGSGGVDGQGSGNNGQAGGGGGGGYFRKSYTRAQLSASETVTIGAAGAAASSGANNGSAGGATTFKGCTGNGGGGGQGMTGTTSGSANGGAPGTASGGDVNVAGEGGSCGMVVAATRIPSSGRGGGSLMGLAGAQHEYTSAAGVAGSGWGAGAAGATVGGVTTNYAGAAGTAGAVRVTEYFD